MTANINEAVQKIKKVGVSNTRIVPMEGQTPIADGLQAIEIRENNTWYPVVKGVTRSMAEEIVGQAVNRVILG